MARAVTYNGMDPPARCAMDQDHEPESGLHVRAKLLDVKDWLIFRATGALTDATSANLAADDGRTSGQEGWSPFLASRLRNSARQAAGRSSTALPFTGRLARSGRRRTLDWLASSPVPAMSGTTTISSGAVEDGQLHVYAGTGARGWAREGFSVTPAPMCCSTPCTPTIASGVGFRHA
ncbi:MAG: hypothetical protein HPM95_05200 [Alphaproteobacteria bacterium]|nr:hypothetical protein [Alphaproteobacteria bacterium]